MKPENFNENKYLSKELALPHITLANRLIMPPMATSKASADGKVTEQILDYYDGKSKGGYIGLIITEHSYIAEDGKASLGQMSISKDEDIDGLKKLTEVIHNNKTKVVAQLSHAGGATKNSVTGMTTLGPSLRTNFERISPEKEMTKSDIRRLIDEFACAAGRAKKAGFDGIELHSAHSYLLNQFYSPLTNLRQDIYGGNINGRIRLHLEIIEAVRSVTGADFLLLLRLGARDYVEGGSTIEDAVTACKQFEKAGIDILDISGGLTGFSIKGKAGMQGYFQDDTKIIKKNVQIPIILTGGITDPNMAEQLIKEEKADLIGVGRAILNDSDWAKRAITEDKYSVFK